MELSKKVILVTGGNKGIGYETVKKLLRETDYIIVLTARNEQLGTQTVKNLIQELMIPETRLIFHVLDITNDSNIQNLIQFLQEKFQQIDVLVNNAGIRHPGSEFNYEIAYSTFQTNFYATIKMSDAIIPVMKENGHIINVSSFMGKATSLDEPLKTKICSEELTRDQLLQLAQEFLDSIKNDTITQKGWKKQSYSTSKLMLNAFTGVLHRELRQQGRKIRVNSLNPGWIRTDMGGCCACKSQEEGAVVPAFLVRYEGEVSGEFWDDCQIKSWKQRDCQCCLIY